MKKLWNKYKNHIKNSIIPKEYSHQITMDIGIKKGQQFGSVLIPCTLYAMDHTIDLNPALIRKKDKKLIKIFKTGKKIKYDSNKYIVKLTKEEEKKGYILQELERCKKCGQKLVMAEVKATRYRSCPDVQIKLGDKAKQDLVIPVKFGINKSDARTPYWYLPLMFGTCGLLTAMLFGFEIPTISIGTGITIPYSDIFLKVIALIFIWGYFIPKAIYKSIKLLQWYNSVKDGMVKNPYAKRRGVL